MNKVIKKYVYGSLICVMSLLCNGSCFASTLNKEWPYIGSYDSSSQTYITSENQDENWLSRWNVTSPAQFSLSEEANDAMVLDCNDFCQAKNTSIMLPKDPEVRTVKLIHAYFYHAWTQKQTKSLFVQDEFNNNLAQELEYISRKGVKIIFHPKLLTTTAGIQSVFSCFPRLNSHRKDIMEKFQELLGYRETQCVKSKFEELTDIIKKKDYADELDIFYTDLVNCVLYKQYKYYLIYHLLPIVLIAGFLGYINHMHVLIQLGVFTSFLVLKAAYLNK